MITNFKIFENINLEGLEKGDYVVIEPSSKSWIPYTTYGHIRNRIGQVIRIRRHYDEIDVAYGLDIGDLFAASLDNIKYWSKNKEELEKLILADKYNL